MRGGWHSPALIIMHLVKASVRITQLSPLIQWALNGHGCPCKQHFKMDYSLILKQFKSVAERPVGSESALVQMMADHQESNHYLTRSWWRSWMHHCITKRQGLTHWGRNKMDAISQTIFSTAFLWLKMFEFRLKFHWNLFLGVQLTIFQHWFG